MPANDDIYMNEGNSYDSPGVYYPTEPEAQVEEQIAQSAPKVASYPVMDEVTAWFEQQIKECDDIHNIQVTTMTINGVKYSRTVSVEAQVLAMQLLKEKLRDKAHEFSNFGEGRTDAK